MINYYTIPPKETLSKYIRTFWVLEGDIIPGQPYIHRTMADGSAELFFHYQGIFDELHANDKSIKSITSGITGPTQKYNRYRINQKFGMFGVYLYPFALQPLFNLPASALCNETPDLHTLFGQDGKDLEEKIMLAPCNRTHVALISEYFEKKLSQNYTVDTPVFASIYYLIQTKGTLKVDDLAKQNFLSTRQFERKFKTFSGFSPKLYSRIIRFQSAVHHYGNKKKSLTDIALDCGYYDQSHFIHDFKEFSGYHPKHFFSGKAEGMEWRDV